MSKKIVITEQQYNCIVENETNRHILSEVVKEELSISNRILSLTNNFGAEISKRLNTTEKKQIESGVTKEQFILDKVDFDGYSINISVTNINFLNRVIFNDLFQKYKSYIEYSYTSPLMERKKLFVYIHSCSISGGLVKNVVMDNLQHELEHCYQIILNKAILPKDNNYSIAFNTLNSNLNEKELEYIISEALYYSYSFEQDGYVNGLYQYINNSKTPMIELNDIMDSPACEVYFKLKKYINIIEKNNKVEVDKILKNKFNLTYNKYINILNKACKRFAKKIGNVLALHRIKRINSGIRLNERFDGDLVSI